MSKQIAKSNLLKGVVLDHVDPVELANNVVSAIADAKSVSEQVKLKFDTLNQRVADIIQSGVDFGSTAEKVYESMREVPWDSKKWEGVSLACMLWIGFERDSGYTKANAKQMVSLVRNAVAHKVRIEPGLMNLNLFVKALESKGVPSLENPEKIVRVKPKAGKTTKAGTGTRSARTDRHASHGLVASMGQEGFGTMIRALVNDLDFDALSDDGLQSAIWEFFVTHQWASKDDKGKYKLNK